MELDFKGLAKDLLSQGPSLLRQWLPGGRMRGREYVCGNLSGDKGDSLSINLDTGMWADFAGTDKGGDLISLYAAIKRISQGQAATELSGQPIKRTNGSAHKPKAPPTTLPVDGAVPSMVRGNGKPTQSWCYRDHAGTPLMYIARYDEDGKKFFLPYSWNGQQWIAGNLPKPRPLYGLDRLAKAPTLPVLIVEGEKAADAGQVIVDGRYVAITWPNGAKAVAAADWTPLYGRKILIYPDADEPGIAAAKQIAEILYPHCPEVKLITVAEDGGGHDIADDLSAGMNYASFFSWARENVSTYTPSASPVQVIHQDNRSITITTEPQDIVPTDAEAFWRHIGLAMTKQGVVIMNMDNVQRVFERHEPYKNLLWWDSFRQRVIIQWPGTQPRELTDADTLRITGMFQRIHGLARISKTNILEGILDHAQQNPKNEPLSWLESLEWDGVERLAHFFEDCFSTDFDPYTAAVGRNFFVGMVARVYKPGCKLDNMIILKGGQGIGKSQALGIIGGPWYSESNASVTDKDFFLSLCGRLLIEIAELDSFNRSETAAIKRVVSTPADHFRVPYGVTTGEFPRTCVFVGTTNDDYFLRDNTGARRFWPITCSDINLTLLREQRDQYFAEAVHLFKSGATWWEVPGELADAIAEAHREGDAWEDEIGYYLKGKSETTVLAIASDCLGIPPRDLTKPDQRRIASVLRLLHWSKKQKRVGPSTTSVWTPSPIHTAPQILSLSDN